MFQRLFSRERLEDKVPDLYLDIAKAYPDRYPLKRLVEYDHMDLSCLFFMRKDFQSKVYLPHFADVPYTVEAKRFNGEFYPIFIKDILNTTFIASPEEFSRYKEDYSLDYRIAQEYILPVTPVATHIRLVLSTHRIGRSRREMKERFGIDDHQLDQESIRGAVVLYNTDPNEHRSNHKHGGKPIPLTGEGAKLPISEYEAGLLERLDIDPKNRAVPKEIFDTIFEKRDRTGHRLYDFLFYVDRDLTGIDIMKGTSSLDPSAVPRWFFLEANHGPDNSFVDESKAWVEEKDYFHLGFPPRLH